MPQIDKEKCTGCGKCVEVCGFDALRLEGGKVVADDEKCINCGMCAGHCPVNAMSAEKSGGKKKAGLIKKWARSYAERNGFRLNPENKAVDMIIEGLMLNEENHGARYCPCRIERVKGDICPCVYHKKEIEEKGECHCQFFVGGDR